MLGAASSPRFLKTRLKSRDVPGLMSRSVVPDCVSEVIKARHSSRYVAISPEEIELTPSWLVRLRVVANDTVQLRVNPAVTPTVICSRGVGSPPIGSEGSLM